MPVRRSILGIDGPQPLARSLPNGPDGFGLTRAARRMKRTPRRVTPPGLASQRARKRNARISGRLCCLWKLAEFA